MTERRCETCCWFERFEYPPETSDGFCRGEPPRGRAIPMSNEMSGYWPTVRKTDWCAYWTMSEPSGPVTRELGIGEGR